MSEITPTHAAVSPFLDDIRRREHAARAEGFRAGYAAALEAAAHVADVCATANGAIAGMRGSATPCAVTKAKTADYLRDKIRSLDIPEEPHG